MHYAIIEAHFESPFQQCIHFDMGHKTLWLKGERLVAAALIKPLSYDKISERDRKENERDGGTWNGIQSRKIKSGYNKSYRLYTH